MADLFIHSFSALSPESCGASNFREYVLAAEEQRDGGTEYVCFRGDDESVEMLEGYHLPPQMPLIKRRSWMNRVMPSAAAAGLSGARVFVTVRPSSEQAPIRSSKEPDRRNGSPG